MRWLIGFALLLLALGALRVVGCGDEGVPCQTDEVFFCDLDGVEQFYEDGICVSGICERRESCTEQYMCFDWVCRGLGDLYPASNHCTNADNCVEGTCTYTLEPNGSSCCSTFERYDCSITGGCQYRCTRSGECQDGHCCIDGSCRESRPYGYGCWG